MRTGSWHDFGRRLLGSAWSSGCCSSWCGGLAAVTLPLAGAAALLRVAVGFTTRTTCSPARSSPPPWWCRCCSRSRRRWRGWYHRCSGARAGTIPASWATTATAARLPTARRARIPGDLWPGDL
ncbi:hypothetical protein [Streptosporangium sp. H16]|uniref:hypothetical protein n=1 Tax=Streptosporangium sp. H16 TaxID=3444184 RepID=UPI003F7A3029